jgi:hypothetical protein
MVGLLCTHIEPKNRVVRPIADPFHDVGPVAGIESVAKSFRQRLGVDHDGVLSIEL